MGSPFGVVQMVEGVVDAPVVIMQVVVVAMPVEDREGPVVSVDHIVSLDLRWREQGQRQAQGQDSDQRESAKHDFLLRLDEDLGFPSGRRTTALTELAPS